MKDVLQNQTTNAAAEQHVVTVHFLTERDTDSKTDLLEEIRGFMSCH